MKMKLFRDLNEAREYAIELAQYRNQFVYISPNKDQWEVGGWSPSYTESIAPPKNQEA